MFDPDDRRCRVLERRRVVARLRPAEQTMSAAVAETVAALDLGSADAAAARLAAAYAESIDALSDEEWPRLIGQIGPSLLRCLEQLCATPEAEPRSGGGSTAAGVTASRPSWPGCGRPGRAGSRDGRGGWILPSDEVDEYAGYVFMVGKRI
jgi:hypothetical protein